MSRVFRSDMMCEMWNFDIKGTVISEHSIKLFYESFKVC